MAVATTKGKRFLRITNTNKVKICANHHMSYNVKMRQIFRDSVSELVQQENSSQRHKKFCTCVIIIDAVK